MKDWWRKWSYEIPLALGDALWDVLIVQLAALLDRLTVRQIVAFVPVVILVLAYYHRIPIPPELMLVGDLLAYIDIFSVLFLLGVLSRVATVLFIVKQGAARVTALATRIRERAQRTDFRHRREGAVRRPKRPFSRAGDDDDEAAVIHGIAWA